jgi:hypothetical protein
MTLQRLAGCAGIALASIYLIAFVYFGAFWSYPGAGTVVEKFAYLSANQTSFTLITLLMYVVFGVVLSVLVVGLHEKLKPDGNPVLQIGSLFGVVWIGLVIASGMISTIGLSSVIEYSATDPEQAFAAWRIVSLITESIGGGNELTGGLWVLSLSLVALRARVFAPVLNYLGCVVGAAGVATVYPAEALTILFGLSQIVWFIWIGVALIRESPALAANQQGAGQGSTSTR